MSITSFLIARISEDEEHARAAIAGDGVARMIVWDVPHMVLAECAAKRAILVEHEITMINGTDWGCKADGFRMDRCRTLRSIAAVYNTHPDYLAEWEL